MCFPIWYVEAGRQHSEVQTRRIQEKKQIQFKWHWLISHFACWEEIDKYLMDARMNMLCWIRSDQIYFLFLSRGTYQPLNMKDRGANLNGRSYGDNGAVICWNSQRTISTVSQLHQLTYQAEIKIQTLLWWNVRKQITQENNKSNSRLEEKKKQEQTRVGQEFIRNMLWSDHPENLLK